MPINGKEAGCASECCISSVGDMRLRRAEPISICKSKINDVYAGFVLRDTHKQICRFDITMDIATRVDILEPDNLQIY